MSLLVVGSLALDSVETPFGKADAVLGGSASFFSAAASLFHPVQVVGVVGGDFPLGELDFLQRRGVDLRGVEQRDGDSFHWRGRYAYDMSSAETLETRLGVFAEFRPTLPESFRDAKWVFLANIDPDVQLEVLDQVRAPQLVACDTMNYWIQSRRDRVVELLSRVDVAFLNDAEIRQLTGKVNLLSAAQEILAIGASAVVVKKGEHGAMLFTRDCIFFVPGFPLESVFDPTGAGDSFAGGFLGHLACAGSVDTEELRRAMVCGSTMGSFAVERFSTERLRDLTIDDVNDRIARFRDLTQFDARPIRASALTAI